jgi:putative flippase GtrA
MGNKRFAKYFIVSFTALVFDFLCYLFLVQTTTFSFSKDAVVSYVFGLLISYVLLIKFVFPNSWLMQRRHFEIMLFCISGILGSLVTFCASKLSLFILEGRYIISKIAAASLSFVVVYIFRTFVVFRERSEYC